MQDFKACIKQAHFVCALASAVVFFFPFPAVKQIRWAFHDKG